MDFIPVLAGMIQLSQPLERERAQDAESERGVDAASIAELKDTFVLNATCLALVSGSGVNAALHLCCN